MAVVPEVEGPVDAAALPPLSLYVHLPWCVSKCPYCDFNSHPVPAAGMPEERYIAALLGDLQHDLEWIQGRSIGSIFLGGGTPSLFSPDALAVLLRGIGDLVTLSGDVEITMEANPGTIERGRFAGYRAAGINRVSLGVQSFDTVQLARLGRIHSALDAVEAVAELRAAGVANFNLDLMYGLPGQSLDAAIADVNAAISLEPAHISHYQLTLEPGTAFHGRPPEGLPDGDAAWDLQLACQAVLDTAGYRQYEVSAYAREGLQCRHNLNYWRFGDYLGIGAGAHGKVTHAAQQTVLRTQRQKQPRTYLAAADAAGRLSELRAVPSAELPFEYALNALRLREGFTLAEFTAMTGLPAAALEEPTREATRRGLIEVGPGNRLRQTDLGWRFLTDLQGIFLG